MKQLGRKVKRSSRLESTVYVITGICVPADELYQLKETLAQALASFKFQDSYIQQCVAQKVWVT